MMSSPSSTSKQSSNGDDATEPSGQKVRARCLAQLGHTRKHRSILFVSILVFAALCTTGLTLCMSSIHSQENEVYHEAKDRAKEAGEILSRGIETALLPVFSIAQFAIELPVFSDLPDRIGVANENGSLPFLTNPQDGSFIPFRNVTGVCDDPSLMNRYSEIASTIEANLDMGGVLQNLYLAPQGVVCLAFGPINMTPLIGFDAFNHPAYKEMAESIAKTSNDALGWTGPVILEDVCPTCGLHLLVRLPIRSHSHHVGVNGVDYTGWGFSSAFLSWDAILEQYVFLERFEERGFEFRITRIEQAFAADSGLHNETDTVLIETDGYGTRKNEVTTTMPMGDSQWTFTVQYDHETNKPLLITLSVLGPFFVACLLYAVLVQKQIHSSMRGITMAQQAKVDVERNMTAYFAHELRNPLGAMDCALACMPNDLPAETQELVSGMQLCSSFMSNIMNNLLDVRKMEEGMMVLQSDSLSLEALLQDVRQMNLPAVRSGVEMYVIAETNGKDLVLGDGHRLKQVLNNIVANAVKYTMRGSITLYAGYQGDTVRLECRDTGPGIPKHEQNELFQRFVMRGGAPGSGLGLAIAKQIVDLMGGSIRFDSDPTVKPGTNCIVLLPLTQCVDQSTQSSEIVDESLLEDELSILIVDDIKINRSMLRRRFEKGISPRSNVSEAATGEEALSICESKSFDVIIVDQYMHEAGGVMVGTDVIVTMRRSGIKSLIVGCSGNDLEANFLSAGADLVWGKPLPSNACIVKQLRLRLHDRSDNPRQDWECSP